MFLTANTLKRVGFVLGMFLLLAVVLVYSRTTAIDTAYTAALSVRETQVAACQRSQSPGGLRYEFNQQAVDSNRLRDAFAGALQASYEAAARGDTPAEAQRAKGLRVQVLAMRSIRFKPSPTRDCRADYPPPTK